MASRSSKWIWTGWVCPICRAVVMSGLREDAGVGRQSTEPVEHGAAGVFVAVLVLKQVGVDDHDRAECLDLEGEPVGVGVGAKLAELDGSPDKLGQQVHPTVDREGDGVVDRPGPVVELAVDGAEEAT